FFFSSRRRHTRCLSDWSSDVCSSDLESAAEAATSLVPNQPIQINAPHPVPVVESQFNIASLGAPNLQDFALSADVFQVLRSLSRSEERRVGKECGSWWWRCD